MESLDTQEVVFKLNPVRPWSDVLIAELSELGFDSFVQNDSGISAYGNIKLNVEEIVRSTSLVESDAVEFSYQTKTIEHQNWNENWEKDFHPVFVEEYATILAPFHDLNQGNGLKVIIQPQMSFGTGHHQTTWMMTKALFELTEIPSTVLDMGTGTGVLAIIAEKLGAKKILAIDIEEWSAQNAKENAERNQCKHLNCIWGDVDKIQGNNFGLILVNINKNVLKQQMQQYSNSIDTNGTLILSGFFQSDVPEMIDFCQKYSFKHHSTYQKDEWACLRFIKI